MSFSHSLKLRITLFHVFLCVTTPADAAFSTDSKEPIQSEYHLNPAIDAAAITTATLANALPYAFASKLIQPRCPCDPNEVNSFDRGVIGNNNHFLDSLSDVSLSVAVAGPVLLDALDVGINSVFWEDFTVYVETLSVSGAFTTLAKYTVQRPLPKVYAGQDPALISEPGGYRSFYSGHSSLTFSALTAASFTYNLRHSSSAWPWVMTGVFGTSVALERVAAGRHFYTDVIVGAIAGAGIGLLVPWLHERADVTKGENKRVISLVPSEDGIQLKVTWFG